MHNMSLQVSKYPDVYWGKARDDRTGLVTHVPQSAYKGYTFFSTSKDQSAYLVDMDGNIAHKWQLSYKDIWPNPEHVANIVPENLRILSRAQMFPNGDMLAIYTGVGSTPLGYGLAKVDKNSELIWAYDDAIHHDVEVAQDGTIYTMSHRIRVDEYEGLHSTKAQPPLYEDYLVILSPDGELIKEVSFLDLFANSQTHKHILEQFRRNPVGGDTPAGDMTHPNAFELIPDKLVGKLPFLKKGHILVSFRNLSMLAMIDPENEMITWSMYLPARFQHDPRFLSDGTVILFDNEGHVGPEGRSRVIRVDLLTSEILWSYAGTIEEPLYSAYHSSVDPLPNGNVLITESLAGRLLEVTSDGEIAWDYRSIWRVGDNESANEKVPAFYRGRRHDYENVLFLDN